MLTKFEKLAQRIQETQDFIVTKINQDVTFAAISQELEKLSTSISTGKLIVQIVSIDLASAQALHNFLGTCKSLVEFYEFHITVLSESEQTALKSREEELIDCDVLCLLINWKQIPLNSEWFIKQASNTNIAKRCVVVEIPDVNEQVEKTFQTNFTDLKTWVQSFEPSIEVISLFLSPFYPNAETVLEKNCQRQFEQFIKSLEALVRRRPEDIIGKRIATKLLTHILQIERNYDMEAEALKQEIRQAEGKLRSLKQSDLTDELKEQVEQALRQVNEDKEKFFKQVKLELNQSKAELLDGFSRKSISHKIQSFTDELQPFVMRKGGAKYVQLQSDKAQSSADINIDMMHLCYSHLSRWVIKEWEKIYTYYGEGGVSQLFQKTYVTLNLIPSLKFRFSLFEPDRDSTLFQKSLKDLVAGVRCESSYKEVSVGNYLIRQVRNQWMGVMFLLTFITMVGLTPNKNRREFIKSIFDPIYQFKDSPFLLTLILAIPLCCLFLLLFYNYHNDGQFKLEDEAKKLRKELSNYYQSFAKVSIEKLVQDFMIALEVEEERLRRIIDSAREQLVAHVTEVQKNQLFFKSDLENLIVQQRALDKARADLQKLKKI